MRIYVIPSNYMTVVASINISPQVSIGVCNNNNYWYIIVLPLVVYDLFLFHMITPTSCLDIVEHKLELHFISIYACARERNKYFTSLTVHLGIDVCTSKNQTFLYLCVF